MGISQHGTARILVADDEATIREAYALVLGSGPQDTSNEHSALEAELFGAAENA